MIALISLLVIITVSLIVIRMGAVALSMTGISEDMAVFQAQSAFSGVGFTTKESESVVNHRQSYSNLLSWHCPGIGISAWNSSFRAGAFMGSFVVEISESNFNKID